MFQSKDAYLLFLSGKRRLRESFEYILWINSLWTVKISHTLSLSIINIQLLAKIVDKLISVFVYHTLLGFCFNNNYYNR